MKQPFSITFNDSPIKISFYPEGDACLTVEGKNYRLDKGQLEVLQSVLVNMGYDDYGKSSPQPDMDFDLR